MLNVLPCQIYKYILGSTCSSQYRVGCMVYIKSRDFEPIEKSGTLDELKLTYIWNYNPKEDMRGFLYLYGPNNSADFVCQLWVSLLGCPTIQRGGHACHVSCYTVDKEFNSIITPLIAAALFHIYTASHSSELRINSAYKESFVPFFNFGTKMNHDVIISFVNPSLETNVFYDIMKLQ